MITTCVSCKNKPGPLCEGCRQWVEHLMNQHDGKIGGKANPRGQHCGYTRHPCDTYDLSEMVLALAPATEMAETGSCQDS